MMKKMMGFTLAEVLTTLMVIGVVAAMTIPTLMNSTNDQQLKVAYKKAMSVLGQGIQLMVAKEEECAVTDNASLATCFTKVLSGTPRANEQDANGAANVIATSDGMAYAFYYFGPNNNNAERSLEEICGTTMGSDEDAYNGKGALCMVVVDVNGLSKGAKKFQKNGGENANNDKGIQSAISTDYANATDQQPILVTGTGVRPIYNSGNTGSGIKGYEWMFGTTSQPWTD